MDVPVFILLSTRITSYSQSFSNPRKMRLPFLFLILLSPLYSDLPELGTSIAKVERNLGKADRSREDDKGFLLNDYFSEGLLLAFAGGQLKHIVVQKNSEDRTAEGLSLGDDLDEVKKIYGNVKEEQVVEKWFAGSEARVLYRHKSTQHLKVNFPAHNLVVFLSPKGRVTSMLIGYISDESKS